MLVNHELEPIYNSNSKILILGSLPSIKSRSLGFYYMHPQNRFWPIMESLFSTSLPTIASKKVFLLNNNLALWDVIASCDITNSSDNSIKEVTPNNLNLIINNAPIKAIFCLGKTSYKLFFKYNNYPHIKVYLLPSPSSANATHHFNTLVQDYQLIKDLLTCQILPK